jgi:class 3 adenylate cyclase
MREELSAVNPIFKDVRLGWGITTGEVIISHYGSRGADVAIVGDSTNLAFRLSDIANKQAPNEIVICSRTAELVRGSVPLVELGSLPIRGRSGKEKVFGVNV